MMMIVPSDAGQVRVRTYLCGCSLSRIAMPLAVGAGHLDAASQRMVRLGSSEVFRRSVHGSWWRQDGVIMTCIDRIICLCLGHTAQACRWLCAKSSPEIQVPGSTPRLPPGATAKRLGATLGTGQSIAGLYSNPQTLATCALWSGCQAKAAILCDGLTVLDGRDLGAVLPRSTGLRLWVICTERRSPWPLWPDEPSRMKWLD